MACSPPGTLGGRDYLSQGSANYSPWAKSGLEFVTENKIALEHSYMHLFVVNGCLPATIAALSSSCNRDIFPTMLKLFTIWPFTKNICWSWFTWHLCRRLRATPLLTGGANTEACIYLTWSHVLHFSKPGFQEYYPSFLCSVPCKWHLTSWDRGDIKKQCYYF